MAVLVALVPRWIPPTHWVPLHCLEFGESQAVVGERSPAASCSATWTAPKTTAGTGCARKLTWHKLCTMSTLVTQWVCVAQMLHKGVQCVWHCHKLQPYPVTSCDFFLRWVGPPLKEPPPPGHLLARAQSDIPELASTGASILAQQHIEAYPCHGVSIFRNWHIFSNW